jgi:hypothetical protein
MKIMTQTRPASPEVGVALVDSQTGANTPLGTHVFLIAPGAQELASWDRAQRRKKGVNGEFERSAHWEVLAEGRAL